MSAISGGIMVLLQVDLGWRWGLGSSQTSHLALPSIMALTHHEGSGGCWVKPSLFALRTSEITT